MDENKERRKGQFEELGGNIKQAVGGLVGDEQMEAEGRARDLQGEGRQETAETVGTAKGMAQEAKGTIKQGLGNLAANEQMQAEGKAEELRSEARQQINR
jgi:uncharacterized protein YjbJ (UPF0337 family)